MGNEKAIEILANIRVQYLLDKKQEEADAALNGMAAKSAPKPAPAKAAPKPAARPAPAKPAARPAPKPQPAPEPEMVAEDDLPF